MTLRRPANSSYFLWASLLAALLAASSRANQPGDAANSAPAECKFLVGGCGGAYLLAEPGELVIDVYKRDRNRRGRTTQLRAILFGPDRQVLDEVSIPDDGRPRGSGLGPIKQARLSASVKHKGVYGLNITVSQDRYGEEMVWGFNTNCPSYLIETSRGHRDARHEEPIVLLNPGQPATVCFVPRRDAFGIEVSGLPQDVNQLSVFNAAGQLVQKLAVDENGQASHSFAKDPDRGGEPWRLEFASQQATIHIDGVTRWSDDDLVPNVPCWTPDPTSFFPFLQHRWLLTPYRRIIYAEPGSQQEFEFRISNGSRSENSIVVTVESDNGVLPDGWARGDKEKEVRWLRKDYNVRPGRSRSIKFEFLVPTLGKQQIFRIRATPEDDPEFTTYSTLIVRGEKAPATKPLDIPIQLRPYEHENQQFGYLPNYPATNQFYFGVKNRPYMCLSGGIAKEAEPDSSNRGGIEQYGFRLPGPTRNRPSIAAITTKIAFDRYNDLYVLGRADGQAVLLRSTDQAKSFSVSAIPGRENQPCTFDIEQFSGHNTPQGPPPIVRFTRTAADPKLIWRRINDLELFLPKKEDERISMGKPILLSRKCIGLSSHSGIPSSIVSRDDKVHVAWGEATDPNEKTPGVPTYVVTYDRKTGRLGEPALVAYGPPANDIHNSPSITIDSQGYLHVLAGTHGQPFPYCRSVKPNDAGSGWTKPELVGDGRQTYVGLVCGADDTLHVVFRMWRSNMEPHPLSHHATLAYQRKKPGQRWEEPRVLITAPFSEYSIFYHRLTIDRIGRLFLSYDYWSTYWFYRNDHHGDRRALLMSPDAGNTWKLAETPDLLGPIAR